MEAKRTLFSNKTGMDCTELSMLDLFWIQKEFNYFNGPKSLDMNLYQNVICANNPCPTTRSALYQTLSDLWNSLPNEYFEKIMGSIFKIVKALKDLKGLSTEY